MPADAGPRRLPWHPGRADDMRAAALPVLLEVCVDDAEGLATAIAAGADRIELCADLSVGGLTPSLGLMRHAATCGRPAYAMIRPRAGDYCFSADEAAIMIADIEAARDAGLPGVVIGATRADHSLDTELLAKLVAAARPLDITLNRVFDLAPDPFAALDETIALGIPRILTSGQATSAADGIDTIRALVTRAAGRLSIMAGAGVTPGNAAAIVARTGVSEIHGSFSQARPPAEGRLAALGFAPPATRRRTDFDTIHAARSALAGLAREHSTSRTLEAQT